MDADALRAKGLHPQNPRLASVEGMALRLGERATLIPDPTGCVHGVLMSLTHEEIDQLYAEPSVASYRPDPVIAILQDGATAAALCFNLPKIPDQLQSDPDYATKLKTVAKHLGLPKTYIENIGRS